MLHSPRQGTRSQAVPVPSFEATWSLLLPATSMLTAVSVSVSSSCFCCKPGMTNFAMRCDAGIATSAYLTAGCMRKLCPALPRTSQLGLCTFASISTSASTSTSPSISTSPSKAAQSALAQRLALGLCFLHPLESLPTPDDQRLTSRLRSAFTGSTGMSQTIPSSSWYGALSHIWLGLAWQGHPRQRKTATCCVTLILDFGCVHSPR